jgi:ATP-dependent DNA helicase RecQ
MTGAQRVLQRVFGLDEFRPGQREIIAAVLAGRDTIGVMPTGAGKSLCYQVPALLLHGTTLVISPLISLMKDQSEKLTDVGIAAAPLNSSLTARETSEHLERIADERAEFVLTTPERLATAEFQATLRQTPIDIVVVDEAHCVSEWGHDFRPAYLEIRDGVTALRPGRTRPPILALTATATEQVLASIVAALGLTDFEVVNTGVYRPNLHFEVRRTVNEAQKREQLTRLIGELAGTGIVYAATVKQVEELTAFFRAFDIDATKYHGRMSARERHDAQDRFMNGEVKTIVATNAFGLGIDKPDIRFVIHYNLPGSLEAYYQEAGRAGRDGAAARCILFFRLEDRRTQRYFAAGKYPRADHVRAVYHALQAIAADGAPMHAAQVAGQSGVPLTKVRVILTLLTDVGAVSRRRGGGVALKRADLSGGNLDAIASMFQTRAEADLARLDAMMSYGQSARCRWAILLEYFTTTVPAPACGLCDNCLNPVDQVLAG